MRKRSWCVVVLILTAVGVSFGVHHAHRHPVSVLGRSMLLFYQLSGVYGPLVHVSAAAIQKPPQHDQAMPAPVITACEARLDPLPEAAQPPIREESEESVIDVTQGRLPGKIFITEVELVGELIPPPSIEPAAELELAAFRPGPPMDVLSPIEGPADLPYMPYCTDPDDAPVPMPRVEEPEAQRTSSGLFRFWSWLFPNLMPRVRAVTGAEESEPNLAPRGTECREDPFHHFRHPVDPHSHHSDRMICPYSGKSVPQAIEDMVEYQKYRKPKAALKADPENADADHARNAKKAKPANRKKKRKSEKKALEFEDTPAPKQPGVDTMEFRPSDWGKNEAKVGPF